MSVWDVLVLLQKWVVVACTDSTVGSVGMSAEKLRASAKGKAENQKRSHQAI